MPLFEYTAIDAQGKSLRGSVDADTERAARQKLRSQAIFPTGLREGSLSHKRTSNDIGSLFKHSRVSLGELSSATRQLATLIVAGLPLVEALQALADQLEGTTLQQQLVKIREAVEEGSTFATALSAFPKSFPSLYLNMVASGETAGTLDTTLANLADYLEAQVELRRKVGSALLYPAIMLLICTAVLVGLLVFVIPSIVTLYQRQGVALPLPTQIVIGASNFLVSYWYLLLALFIAAILLTKSYYAKPNGRSKIDRLLLRVPLYGQLLVKLSAARVAQTLGALLSSGVDLLRGLDIAKNIVHNVHMKACLEDARDGVREGRSLAREIAKAQLFPALLCQMIAVGERSGELEAMLVKAGKSYENEVNVTVSGLTTLLEPLMIVMVGLIVLFIVVATLLPMIDMINLVQN